MTLTDPYNDTVRACFEKPGHAGDLQGEYAQSLEASAASSDQGMTVALSVGISDGMIVEMRFRAWACPHLIAAAQMLCADRQGRLTDSLQQFDVNGVMQQLSIPVEKTGRVLLLEDAVTSLWQQYTKLCKTDSGTG